VQGLGKAGGIIRNEKCRNNRCYEMLHNELTYNNDTYKLIKNDERFKWVISKLEKHAKSY